jgi:hypothetical protein
MSTIVSLERVQETCDIESRTPSGCGKATCRMTLTGFETATPE